MVKISAADLKMSAKETLKQYLIRHSHLRRIFLGGRRDELKKADQSKEGIRSF